MFRRIAISLTFMMLVDAGAQAAVIALVDGAVSVSDGAGFKAATLGHMLKPGDRVMVTRFGKARVLYDDDCVVEVTEHKLLTIHETSPCARSGDWLGLEHSDSILSEHTRSLLHNDAFGVGMGAAPVGTWLWLHSPHDQNGKPKPEGGGNPASP